MRGKVFVRPYLRSTKVDDLDRMIAVRTELQRTMPSKLAPQAVLANLGKQRKLSAAISRARAARRRLGE